MSGKTAPDPETRVSPGGWYVPLGGTVAHCVRDFFVGRVYGWSYCANAHEVKRTATPEDRRCKRCEERSRG